MALHFTPEELQARVDVACAALSEQGLDGLLMFRQESMYYLTGYDTFGFVYFQCLVLRADGRMVLLTRSADLRQARHTSTVEDVRVWVDEEGSRPALVLRDILDELGLGGRRLGVEYEAYGLSARRGRQLDSALDGFARLVDASELVSRQRVVKSEAELAYVREAGRLADAGLLAAIETTRAGVSEAEVLAAMQGAELAGGGDLSANPPVIGSGPDALLCRYRTGRRVLDPIDQLTLEFAGVFRHYHVAWMRTLYVGEADDRQRAMFLACQEALGAAEAGLAPGVPMGAVFDAQAAVLDAHRMRPHRLNACGYALGATFQPNWMDWPMFYTRNPVRLQAGMVVFLHMILADSDTGRAATLGRTSIVGPAGPEPLSQVPLELVVR
jgi:Xaa-Pro dipeptidase